MTIFKKDFSITDSLLSVILLMLGVIGWFFYGVVTDVRDMKKSAIQTVIEVNKVVQWTNIYGKRVDDNTKRINEFLPRIEDK